jgi:hypothetical protein
MLHLPNHLIQIAKQRLKRKKMMMLFKKIRKDLKMKGRKGY